MIKNHWLKITILKALGSTPREKGAFMLLSLENAKQIGSIGGGALEYRATALAYELYENGDLSPTTSAHEHEFHLGPALEQCCGGYVKISVECLSLTPQEIIALTSAADKGEKQNIPLLIFGAGHVGQDLYQALTPLPFSLSLYDNRQIDSAIRYEINDLKTILSTAPNAIIYIMTHCHKLDLDLCAEILKLGTFAHLGVIGSKTKKARFQNQLRSRGLSEDRIQRMQCPIGVSGISGKEPAVIAASVTAEALRMREIILAQNGQRSEGAS